MQNLGRKLSSLVTLSLFALVVAVLSIGKPLLMPLALAVLLTFLLNPVVNSLHRHGLGRAPAVVMVALLLFSLMGGIAWAIGTQLSSLASELPSYKDNIRKKVIALRTVGKGGTVERMQTTLNEIIGELKEHSTTQQTPPQTEAGAPPAEEPVPVVVKGSKSLTMFFPSALGPLTTVLATLGLVIVLVVFMLLRLQELRNRLIRLCGYSRLTTTTKAIDEAGERISRYLLMQSLINATYGIALAFGLSFIGLPYVALFGFLAALARFIPYVGPWIGALLPIALSLAVFDGWLSPVLIIALILVLELGSNMFMEPWLYGHSVGVSEVALIIAVAFWTWIWGPVGLALATPLTVCMVVLCKYIPELEFIELLIGDEPVMDKRLVFYQRLLARDREEAAEILNQFLASSGAEPAVDALLIPALNYAKRDFSQERISELDRRFITDTIRGLAEKLVFTNGPVAPPSGSKNDSAVQLLGRPDQDDLDEVALFLLQRMLQAKGYALEIISPDILSSELLALVQERGPAALCIGSLAANPLASSRYLCKRLRDRLIQVKIVVGRWPESEPIPEMREQLASAGADFVAVSLVDARNHMLQLAQLYAIRDEPEPQVA